MAFKETREKFLQLLGGKCECGEDRQIGLELTKKNSYDTRKINHVLRESGVEERFDVLKEDFLILCLICKRIKEANDVEFKNKRSRLLQKSRAKHYKSKIGKPSKALKEEPLQEFPSYIQNEIKGEVKAEEISNEFDANTREMIRKNPSIEAMLRRLKSPGKKHLTSED